jgi:hypothetical protein
MKKKLFYFAIFLVSVFAIIFSCQKDEMTSATDNLLDEQTLTPDYRYRADRIFTVEPNGVDDTENLQAAFDAAVATGAYCKVVLTEGVYRTGLIFVENFKGIFEGAGKDATIIHSVPGLDAGEVTFWETPAADNPWPCLFTFSGGDIKIYDLTFQIDDLQPVHWTYGEWEGYEFLGIVMITGETTNSTVERAGFEGMEIPGGGFLGYNVGNALFIQSPYNTPWIVSGTHRVYSSSFTKTAVGVTLGLVGNTHLVVGGSASKGNVFENVYTGVEVSDFSKSFAEVSFNQVTGATFDGMSFMQGYYYSSIGEFAPEMSQVHVRHNNISAVGSGWGMELNDLGSYYEGRKLMDIQCSQNQLNLVGEGSQFGTYCIAIQDGMFNSNVVTGSGNYGSVLNYGTSGCNFVNNNYEGFVPAYADIILTASTSNNKVVCGRYESDVWDFGTDNDVVCPGFDFRSDASNTAQNMETLTERRANTQFPWLIKK